MPSLVSTRSSARTLSYRARECDSVSGRLSSTADHGAEIYWGMETDVTNDKQQMLDLLVEHGKLHDLKQVDSAYVTELHGRRHRKDGTDMAVIVKIRDYGADSPSRYYCVAEDEDGRIATGNPEKSIDTALALVHWSELDAAGPVPGVETTLVGFSIHRGNEKDALVRIDLEFDAGPQDPGRKVFRLELHPMQSLSLYRAIAHELDRRLIPGFEDQ